MDKQKSRNHKEEVSTPYFSAVKTVKPHKPEVKAKEEARADFNPEGVVVVKAKGSLVQRIEGDVAAIQIEKNTQGAVSGLLIIDDLGTKTTFELYPELIREMQKENVAVGDSIVFDKPANKITKTKENEMI